MNGLIYLVGLIVGYVAGRMRLRATAGAEVELRDGRHGIVTVGLAVVLTAVAWFVAVEDGRDRERGAWPMWDWSVCGRMS